MTGALKPPWDRVTLAGLAEGAASSHGASLFVRDCPDRAGWNDEPPRALNFMEFAKQARFFGCQMQALGLKAGARILLLLPNTVELAIAVVGSRAAGLVPAIAPIEESADALRGASERIGAEAIITTARVEETRLAERARQIAARQIGIRIVAGFGLDLPDGVMPLDGWSEDEVSPLLLRPEKAGSPAVITFARREGSLAAFLRSEAQVVADALAFAARARLGREAGVIATLQPGSAAALMTGLIAPILLGMPVQLVGPFRAQRLMRAAEASPGASLIAPLRVTAAVATDRHRVPALHGLGGMVALRRPGDEALAMSMDTPPIPLLDLDEAALLPLGAWPAEGLVALDGEHHHPLDQLLPERMPLLSLRRLGNTIAIAGGFGEARVIERDNRRGAHDAA